MKARLCIVGGNLIIKIAEKVASEFRNEADFLFIEHLLEDALPFLHGIEDNADIVIAGPSTMRICLKHITIPVISFRPTFPDVILAIQEAKNIDTKIAICLSRDDCDFDIPLLSKVMNVSLLSFYCDTKEEYEKACKLSKEKGYQIVIGGSFTVNAAEKFGMKGILLYKGTDMIRTAVKKAIEICKIQHETIRRISQLSAVVNNINEGLLLTDERGRVILDNPLSQKYLGSNELYGKEITELFESKIAVKVLKQGNRVMNVIERGNLVVNYVPIRLAEKTHGLVCIFKKVDEVQDAEITIRKKLHDKGFRAKYTFNDIIGDSQVINICKEKAILFARSEAPILITGESGTGKELFAQSIHNLSNRRDNLFVAINCATLPSELLESELFGYEKGAFTGAHASGKRGLIELAHKGTLFLDEITSLNCSLQAKLLRLLAEKEILKLGSDRIIPVDIRIIAATNTDIESCVADYRFREDLYYRLNVFRLHIPPLRERPEDLVPLFLHFVSRIRNEILEFLLGKERMIFEALVNESFNGNVRELENIATRFCLMFDTRKHAQEKEMRILLNNCLEKGVGCYKSEEIITDLKTALKITEKRIIQEIVKRHKNKNDILQTLGVNRSTLWRKMKKYGIQS